jgi:hypothetical protein
VDPRTGLNMERRKSCSCRDSNSGLSIVQTVANLYADCDISKELNIKICNKAMILSIILYGRETYLRLKYCRLEVFSEQGAEEKVCT